ncbi:hypothetical protein [Horticoccus sp. 23ND18S-11]|uniref:hypothetical protein n=1 Tax=Horticoccus sp. 23ND18S-11 TaxID=3391832 RepID=UPI0039C8FBFB
MKRIKRIFLTTIGSVIVAAGLYASEPSLLFSGYLVDGNGARYSLKNSDSGKSSWVEIGQQFEGYTLRSFDKIAEVLIVSKESAEFRLRLAHAHVKKSVVELTPEKEEMILKNLRILAAAADQYFVDRKVVVTSYDELIGLRKYVKEDVTPVDGESYRAINFSSEKMEVTTTSGHTVSYLR